VPDATLVGLDGPDPDVRVEQQHALAIDVVFAVDWIEGANVLQYRALH
jgi:hypothetical protein